MAQWEVDPIQFQHHLEILEVPFWVKEILCFLGHGKLEMLAQVAVELLEQELEFRHIMVVAE